jgi:SNF2-related domain/Helicase conserved C-terminal domain
MARRSSVVDITPAYAGSSAAPSGPLQPLGALQQVLRGERVPVDLMETRQVLMEVARRKSGRIPAALLVEQVLSVTEGTDWPCRRAAMDALLRRVGFAERDGLTLAERPAGNQILGSYVLASGAEPRRGKSVKPSRRPYRTELHALEPLRVSCDCADFVRSSLGLCKHSLVVLEYATTPRRGAAALALSANEQKDARLGWDPRRSWTGAGDRVAGLRWHGPRAAAVRGRPAARVRGWFETIAAAFAQAQPAAAVLAEPERRFALLQALAGAEHEGVLRVEPAARAVVHAELELAERRALGRASAPEALRRLATLKRKLYPYQRDGVRRFLEEQRLLLADDMGLGKTTQAIAACHVLYESGRVRRGLLIVPAPLKDQWQREWQATTDRVPLAVIEGPQAARARQYRQTKEGFLVMNYEQLLRDLESVQRFAPQMVVLDEAQRIKNWATKSNAYVMSLDPEWRLVLTGTPMENRLEELATLLDWIDDAALAPKWRLQPWHTEWGTVGRAQRVGARHLDTLRQRVDHCVMRRIRREVLSQLPPRTDVRAAVEMTGQQREEHDALIVPIAVLMQTARRRPLRQPEFLKLMQLLAQQRIISNGMALLRFDEVWPSYSRGPADEALLAASCSPKLLELRRLISELVLDQGRKVVVFSQWRRMLKLSHWAVQDLLEAQGLRAVFFTGEESQAARTHNIVDFHDDESVRVMFLSDAGGVGLNLQRAATACINLELPWNPAVLEQRVGRIYRLGQTQPIDVINLVSEYGIEARIAGLIGNKKALFSGLFDGTTDAVRFDAPAGFLADIERLVEPVKVPAFIPDGDAAEDTDVEAPDVARTPDAPSSEPDVTLAENGQRAVDTAAVDTVAADTVAVHTVAADTVAVHTVAADTVAVHQRAVEPRVAALFERISVTRTEGGGLRLEAPPDAAEELSQLLRGLAQLLGATKGHS